MKEKSKPACMQKTCEEKQQDIEWFITFWNRTLDEHNARLQRLPFLTTHQRSQLRTRQATWGREAMRQMVINAATSDYLNGRRGKAVNMSLDWYLVPQHFANVLQGKYNDAAPVERVLTPAERRRQEAEEYAARQRARRAENLRIDEEERLRREQQREEWSREAATPDEIKRILGDKWLIG